MAAGTLFGSVTPKERILATFNRQPVDRLPVNLWHTPEIAAALRKYCGVSDDMAMWEAFGLDKIEGDLDNSRYWYYRAGKMERVADEPRAELATIKKEIVDS